ncbi:MAG: MFS transporter [Rhodospirillales bacterium 70-18]|nr:MFS transporter [Rhodospirillales bacterium]OJY65768.1 MAG: MFS transporter [Rhodospirillales bacterium 70-18]
MCLLAAVNQLGFGAVVPVLPLYARSFGVSTSAIGLSIGVYGLARMLVSAPAAQISDRLGRRHALALGGLVTALGNLWCGLAGSYPEFVLARFLAGAGAGLIVTTGQIVLADITTPERRGRVMAIYQGVFIFAAGIGPLPGGLLAEYGGLAAPFAAYSVAGVLAGVLAWAAVGETREAGGGAHAASRPSLASQVRVLAGHRGFALVCLVSLVNAAARTGGLFNIVPLVGSGLGLTVAAIGFAMAMGSVMGLLVAYPSGMLVDHFGRKAVIAPATVITGASMLLFCVAPSFAWFVAASLVWGVASGIGGAAPATYAADSAPRGMNATTMSMFRMVGDAGYVAGPLVLGLAADLYGAQAALIGVAALLAATGAGFAALAPETYRGRGR